MSICKTPKISSYSQNFVAKRLKSDGKISLWRRLLRNVNKEDTALSVFPLLEDGASEELSHRVSDKGFLLPPPKSTDAANKMDPMPEFTTVEQRMIDLNERKLHPYYKRFENMTQRDLVKPHTDECVYRCQCGPISVEDIPKHFKFNPDLVKCTNKYSAVKSTEPHRGLIVKILEMELNKKPTLECVQKMIFLTVRKVFPNNESVIYMYEDNQIPITEENPTILFDVRNQITVLPPYRNFSHNYVIRADYYKNLAKALTSLAVSGLWNNKLMRQGKFILITLDENLQHKVTLFWKLGIINLIILLYDSEDSMAVLTSDPQAPSNDCGLMLKEFLNFDDCFASTRIQLPKILRKFTNCNVTYWTSTIDRSNSVKLFASIRFLLDLMDKTQNVSVTTISSIRPNLFTMSVHLRSSFDNFEYTSTFFSDRMVWIVPFPPLIPNIKLIGIIFKDIVWIFVVIAFIVTSSIWCLIIRLLKRTLNVGNTFLKVFSITLFGHVDKFDLICSLRILFLAYVLYSIHIQTAFSSKLIEILTVAQYERAIATLTELSDSDVKIFVNEATFTHFFQHENLNRTLYDKIRNKFIVQNSKDYSVSVTDLKTFRNSGALLTSNELDILTTVFLIDFYTIEDYTFLPSLELSVAGLPGSYLIKSIDKLISILVESGILPHFVKNVKYEIPIKRQINYSKRTVLSLQHLYIVFVFWFVGLCLSTTAMIFEVIYVHVIEDRN
ncbi:hypothetical protein FQR65_LT09879 [Abscondita terminalis]|nr:hypothetical protein FQR65_LT09879 [Abscondita terminalis]